MDLSLDGRHALVCGASSGIGRAAAEALAAQGARLTLVARRATLLADLAAELHGRHGITAVALPLDLDDVGALPGAAQSCGVVHVLINNSGGPPSGPILQAGPDAFLTAFQRHVLASHELLRATLPGMRKAGYGRIINITSTSVREPIANLGVSNTIRAAMAGWAKSVSKELPPGVTINNVLPGFTDTDRLSLLRRDVAQRTGQSEREVTDDWVRAVPEGRLARPEELGAVIAFLASPAASYIRGTSIAVDGGRLAGI
jgi:3-oxoacyl-[acyl-carrier protein] reductase